MSNDSRAQDTTEMPAATSFILGQRVTWSSQANCWKKTKTGVIVEVVPPHMRPNTTGRPGLYGCGSGRNHESYVVEVPQGPKAKAKHYWPLVKGLQHAA